MNDKIGKIGALVTGVAVAAFAVSMLVFDTPFASCFASMFIALGFLPFMAGIAARGDRSRRAAGYASLAFGAVYAVIILLVYFAECTTVRMQTLGPEALGIISYAQLGSLFFNYDLLGYGMMALSTLFVGIVLQPRNKEDRALRTLLLAHGAFFPGCFAAPMFPVFTSGTDSMVGTILLEIWCAYFLPVCVLGWRYFARKAQEG